MGMDYLLALRAKLCTMEIDSTRLEHFLKAHHERPNETPPDFSSLLSMYLAAPRPVAAMTRRAPTTLSRTTPRAIVSTTSTTTNTVPSTPLKVAMPSATSCVSRQLFWS